MRFGALPLKMEANARNKSTTMLTCWEQRSNSVLLLELLALDTLVFGGFYLCGPLGGGRIFAYNTSSRVYFCAPRDIFFVL